MSERFKEIIQKASVMKSNMMKLIEAKAKCPYCAGYWRAILAGPGQYMHMHCDGDCRTMDDAMKEKE